MTRNAQSDEIRTSVRAAEPERDAVMHLDGRCSLAGRTDRLLAEYLRTDDLPARSVTALASAAADPITLAGELALVRRTIAPGRQDRAARMRARVERA